MPLGPRLISANGTMTTLPESLGTREKTYPCRASQRTKKAGVAGPLQGFGHAGSLRDGPPGCAGLPFAAFSDFLGYSNSASLPCPPGEGKGPCRGNGKSSTLSTN